METICIGKKFTFEAAHKLPDKEIYGKCSNLHGHRYELTIEISGELMEEGWIVNFSDIKDLIEKKIIDELDHSYLNSIIDIPTVENLLIYIKSKIEKQLKEIGCSLEKIIIYETKDSFAKWSRN